MGCEVVGYSNFSLDWLGFMFCLFVLFCFFVLCSLFKPIVLCWVLKDIKRISMRIAGMRAIISKSNVVLVCFSL